MPRTLDVELRGGLVNSCVVGDLVHVTGVLKPTAAEYVSRKSDAGVFSLHVQANSLVNAKQSHVSPAPRPLQLPGHEEFSEEDFHAIEQLALSENCLGILLQSLCPSIYGHELVKLGLVLSLFGGSDSESSKRSDIHVLVVGDPGLGKSQMIRAACNVAPRSVFVSGNTTTTAGISVAIHRESSGGEVNEYDFFAITYPSNIVFDRFLLRQALSCSLIKECVGSMSLTK